MNKVEQFILKVQKEVCKVKRDTENEFTKSKYADIESVLDLLNPYIREHSALIIQSPVLTDSGWALATTIKIEDDKETFLFPLLGLEGKSPMQALGSANTYARRYALKGIFKLVDSDDDGNSATLTGSPAKPAGKTEVSKMLRVFAALNVSKIEIESRYKLDVDQFTTDEMSDLASVYNAMKSGKKKDEFFSGESEWQE